MRISRPSPATVIATVALVMATTGTAVAAVNYASNAGRVDGLSAVSAGSSNNRAAGNLVATARGGSNKGKIPNKFLADVAESNPFVTAFNVEDNATGATAVLSTTPLGTLSASCQDQSNAAGTEDPRTVITFTNSSGVTINFARRPGASEATIGTLANGTVDSLTINGSNTFRYQIESNGLQLLIDGVVRQDRPAPNNGTCFVYGTVQAIR
jgi:hypothetical protein